MTVPAPAQDTSALEACFPLSPSQQGMLYHTLLEPGAGVFLEQMVGWLPEALDLDAFLAAWRSAIERHAVLRTGFRFGAEGGGQQEVHRSVQLEARVDDWSGLPAEAQEARVAAFLAADRARGFDLEQPPLHRLALFRLGPAEYRMVFTFHHAILDSRGLTLLFQEVFGGYEAALGGKTAPTAPVHDFSRYVAWLETLDLGAAEQHWRGVLSGFTSPTPLVVDRPSTVLPDGIGRQGHRIAWLSADATSALERAAKAHGVTMNTVIQGAWAVLLGRYSGESSVVFGASRACRKSSLPEVAEMVAHLVNTLPLRARLEPDAPFFPWLRSLRDQWMAMRDFEHTPPARVQAWSDVPAGMPVFETVVNYDSAHYESSLQTPSNLGRARRFEMFEVTNYPLALMAYGGERCCVKIEFDQRRFEEASIDRMLTHLVTLLEDAAGKPTAGLGELALLSAEELHTLLVEWNPAEGGAPPAETLVTLFEAQVARTPERVALEYEGTRLSYGQLNAAANRVAHRLRERGVGPETLVGLCAERSLDLVVGLLGILKAGGAYVPIDLATPADRVAFILADSRALILLTQRHLENRVPAGAHRTLCLEDLAAEGTTENLAPAGGPDDLAYVIYTSGSTGKPKGVLVTHRNVTRLFASTEHWFGFGPEDVWTLFHSYAFDFSVWEIWGALLYGGHLVVVPYEVSRSPEAFVALVAKCGVTVLNQTPSAFRQFIAAEQQQAPAALALRWVIFGGEALDPASLSPWFERSGDLSPQLVNMYGITETTVHVTYRRLSRDDLTARSVIGVPIPDLQVYVLDPFRRPVPIGVPGELYVGGAGLARGYLRRPELTAERFVDSPFRPGEKLYRTGDRARLLAGRDIEYLGRLDFQVKIRGFRIELGEIEAALAAHPQVQDTVVLCREDHPGEKRLAAYYVARDGGPLEAAELRRHLQTTLPEYMIPAVFIPLAILPLTSNGKVDRTALPAPSAEAIARPGFLSPTTPVERMLADTWAKVLRVDRVGVRDNYYELGGDSILSIQIAARARACGLPVTTGLLLKHQTVADLAAALERLDSKAEVATTPVGGEAPLTPIQRWFFALDPAEPHHWNQAFLFATTEALDFRALSGACHALLDRHDALRLRFTKTDGAWRQRFASAGAETPLRSEDLSALSDSELAGAIAAAAGRAATSLDLARGPLLAAVHLRLGGTRGERLLIAVHHLVVDGVSWRILLEDLEAEYHRLRAGSTPELPPRTSSFQRWAEGLTALAASGALASELPYWTGELSTCSLRLPVDGSRDAPNTEGDAGVVTIALDAADTGALLTRAPAAYNTQINDLLITALSDALGAWAGPGSLLVDLEGHGREDVVPGIDLTRTVGWFTSIYPFRLELGAGGNAAARLKAMKERLRAVPRRGIGYGILRWLAGERALDAGPGGELLFNYLGQFDQLVGDSTLLGFAAEDPGPWRSPRAVRSHLLEINTLVRDGRLQFRWTFGRDVHHEATVRGLAERTVSALSDLIRHCTAPEAGGRTPSDFPLVALTSAEVDRLAGDGGSVEDILPLAPMQALFLATTGGGSDVGFEQWYYALSGRLDVSAFRRAWEHVVERHAILRSSFAVEGLKAPVQVIQRRVVLPLEEHDWRGLDEAARAGRFDALLAGDRARGFAVDQAPLFRLSLVRTGEERWTLVWSHHHLLLDRWSFPIVLREVGVAYEAFRTGRQPDLPPAPSWKRYLTWQREQDPAPTEEFWREALRDAAAAALPRLGEPDGSGGQRALSLSIEETARLAAAARERKVTLNTMISLAWALWLARMTSRTDVVFGMTVAGRAEDVPGIADLVGMCINNLPTRLRLDPEESVAAALDRLSQVQQAFAHHEHASLMEVQRWSGLPWHQRLIDTLVIFQHQGAEENATDWLGGSIEIRMAPVETRTNFPLALVVRGGASASLQLSYLGRHADGASAEAALRQVRDLLLALLELMDRPVRLALASLPAPVPERRRERTGAPEAPRSNTEWVVAHIWAELLGKKAVGRDDDFFDLGGHSLVATQIVSRLRDAFRMELPISLLFTHPGLADFAAALQSREAAPGQAERIATIVRKVEEMGDAELLEAGISG